MQESLHVTVWGQDYNIIVILSRAHNNGGGEHVTELVAVVLHAGAVSHVQVSLRDVYMCEV